MKLVIITTLALFIISVSSYGVDINKLLNKQGGGIIFKQDLKYIIDSQYNTYNVVMTFFTQADFDKGGKLTFVEFAKAYGNFIYFLTGKQIDQTFIYARFQLADFANNNDQIDLAEFTFLILLDLRFIYNNYCLISQGLSTLPDSVTKLTEFLENGDKGQANWIFQGVFFGFDFNKDSKISAAEFRSGVRILGHILGINFSYTKSILNDFFWLADLDDDMQLSAIEASKFINDHLQQAKLILTSLSKL